MFPTQWIMNQLPLYISDEAIECCREGHFEVACNYKITWLVLIKYFHDSNWVEQN